jgi:hypothetical protein
MEASISLLPNQNVFTCTSHISWIKYDLCVQSQIDEEPSMDEMVKGQVYSR